MYENFANSANSNTEASLSENLKSFEEQHDLNLCTCFHGISRILINIERVESQAVDKNKCLVFVASNTFNCLFVVSKNGIHEVDWTKIQQNDRSFLFFFFHLSINRWATGCRADLSKRQTFVCRRGDMTSRGTGVRKNGPATWGFAFPRQGICGSRRRISPRIACHQILTRHPRGEKRC